MSITCIISHLLFPCKTIFINTATIIIIIIIIINNTATTTSTAIIIIISPVFSLYNPPHRCHSSLTSPAG